MASGDGGESNFVDPQFQEGMSVVVTVLIITLSKASYVWICTRRFITAGFGGMILCYLSSYSRWPCVVVVTGESRDLCSWLNRLTYPGRSIE